MRAKRKTFRGWLTRLLVAGLVAVPIQFLAFATPAQAVAPPGSINLVNLADGPSALTTTLTEEPGTGDLTYEFWYNMADDSGWPREFTFFSTQSTANSSDGFRVFYSGGQISVYSGNTYLAGMDRSGTTDTWIHMVFMRMGTSKWIIYKNGACRTQFTLSSTTSKKLTIGSEASTPFRGKIANFRYAKSASYSDANFATYVQDQSRFSPPLTALVATPQTKVLLNTVQGVDFALDTSASPNAFTLSSANPPTSSSSTPLPIYAEFINNGGSGTMANQVSNVSANLSSNSFTKSGSTFVGWNTAADGTGDFYKNGATYAFTSSITLYAQWSSDSVPVNFNTDGGSFVAGSSVVIGTAIQSAPTAPTKSGYTFGGWKATAGGSAVTFPYYPILSAGSAAFLSSVPLDDLGRYLNKGTWVSSTSYGPNIGTSPNSTRDFATYTDGRKYIAIRASTNSVLSAPTRLDDSYMVALDSSTTLTAIWVAAAHAVTYSLGGADGTPPTQVDVNTAENFTTASAPTRAGYSFAGWHNGISNTGANTTYTMGDSALTLTAQWTADLHQVSYALDGGSSTLPTQSDVATAITFVAASTPVRTGYTFAGWSDGSTTTASGENYLVGITNVTLTALWTQNTFSVTFDSQNGIASNTATVTSGTSAVAPASPSWYGYNFKGWAESINGALVDVATIAISSVKSFFGIWEQQSIAGLTLAQLGTPDTISPHATLDKTVTSTIGDVSSVVRVPAGALPSTFSVKVYTLSDNTLAAQTLGANNTYLLSQVVSWSDTAAGSVGNIQDTVAGKPIEMTITSPDIKTGAKVYSIINNVSTLLATATRNGSVTVTFSVDPVIVVQAAPVAAPAPPPTPLVTPSPTYSATPVVEPTPAVSTTPSATPTSTPAPSVLSKSFYISGFEPGSWAITKLIKNSIDAFFKSMKNPSKISCVGFTRGPTVLKTDANLSFRRGQEVCRYLGKKYAGAETTVVKGITTRLNSDSYRRVKITFTK
jgi:uncharacterized repeat protein (TIGR02543 family)